MRAFREMMKPVEDRVRGMIARGIVNLVDDAPEAQELQVELLEDERQDGVERLQNYGLTSVPHPEAEAIVVFVGGLRSHAIVIAVEDRRYRLTGLEAGEVALYDDLGNLVKLGREKLEIVGVSEVLVTSPKATIVSDDVNLGATGGQRVARVGDTVAGGVITSGSAKVKAA